MTMLKDTEENIKFEIQFIKNNMLIVILIK